MVLLLLSMLVKCRLFVSAASDVDPDHMAGQRAAEPAAVVGDAAPQTTEEQPTATTAAESSEELPAPARDEEATRTPVMEE